nr:caffeic acid 3-o-methyltransferase [Quercus suber]
MPLWLGCSVVADDFGSFQRLYSLSPVSKHFVRNEDGVSLGPLLALSQDEVFIKSWSQLKGAILEGGIPFNREYGMHAFEYPDLDPMFNKVFNTAMFNHTTIVMKKILESYKGFEQLTQLVDIGGGVEHIGGDMFESIPNGHAIFMKWILHDWSDEYCLKLLKNCYNAIPNDGKVIAVEAVLPTMPENSSSMKSTTHLDLIMMTQNPGGRERTQQEFMALATRAGFSGIRFGCCVSDIWVMEFFK